MRKIRFILKTVSIFLTVILIVQVLPLSTISTAINNASIVSEPSFVENKVVEPAKIIGEVESLRDEYTKHFRCEDGSFVAAVYGTPIHYQNNGKWDEIDNTLISKNIDDINVKTPSLNKAKYSIEKTSTPITFPQNINSDKITITNGNNVISFGVKNNTLSTSSSAFVSASEELISNAISDSDAEKTTQDIKANENAFVVGSQKSAITYTDAFENASVEYEVSSSIIKESIVVHEKSDSYKFEFSVDFGSYVPKKEDSGGFYIYETAESQDPIMAIAPAYMFDADNDVSEAVTMELVQNENDYTLIIEADKSWMNSLFRKFPVVIDPTIILDIDRNDIENVHVNQKYPNSNLWNSLDYQLEVGRNGNNVYRTYIKYNLPELPDCSIVTNAELILTQNWARNISETDLYLNVYQCDSEWDADSITWNNQPIQNLTNATVVDYTNYKNGMSAEYNLNITKIVKNWYENGNNYGLMLASSDESVEEKTSFYASRNIVELIDDVKPAVMVSYVNNTGVEDYWTYDGFSLGKSGSAYINTYNGALTYIHGDVSTNGLLAPLNISHVYNNDSKSSSGTYGNMNFGKGFKLNIIEKIETVNSNQLSNYPYKYIDADGTVHFFKRDSSGFYYEFDSSVRLTVSGSNYIITFADGSTKTFNSSGYLTKTTDSQGNSVIFTYENGRITKVTDGGGLFVTLSYNSNNTLCSITDAAGRLIRYNYNSAGQLSEIIYPDASKTQYEYGNISGFINKIMAFDNMQATIAYKPFGASYKVSSYSTYGNDPNHTLYDKVSFEYRTSDTVVSNTKNDVIVLAFDNTGKVINCIRNGETISVSQFINEPGNSFNKASFVSNAFTPKENLAIRTSPYYRFAHTYTHGYKHNDRCKERLFTQSYCHKVAYTTSNSTDSVYIYTNAPVKTPFKPYTYSMYVSILDTLFAGSVYLNVEVKNQAGEILVSKNSKEITTTNNEWERLSVTLTMPEDAYSVTVSCGIFEGCGVVYIEDLNYTEGEAPDLINLLTNSSFENYYDRLPFYNWGGDYTEIDCVANPIDGSKAAHMFGNPNEEKWMFSDAYLNGKAGDVLVYGASAQALCSASGNNNGDSERFFGIRIKLYKNLELLQSEYITFNKDALNTMQTIMGSIVAEQDYNEAEIELCYNHEINSVIFDDAFLYRVPFGTYYQYDNNGRTQSVRDDNGNEINFSHTGIDLTGVTVKANGETIQTATYAYDNKHNLTSAVGMDDVETSYTYNIKGLPTSVTVSDSSGQSSTTTYNYTNDSNYLANVTDASGATTQYVYNTAKGLVTKVIDPNGNETDYEYDPNTDLLTSVSNPSAELGNPSTMFEHDHAYGYAAIYNDDVGYNFFNDSFGRLEVVDSNSGLCLVINEYDEDGNIEMQCLGQSEQASYTYDDDGRLTSQSFNDILAYEYDYTSSGMLGRMTDHENNVVWDYHYDLAGRATNASSDDGRKISYEYTSKNEVGRMLITDDSSVTLDTRYSYDQYGRPSSAEIGSMTGSPAQSYSYDSLGRTSKITNEYSSDSTVEQNISYLVNGTNQTGRIDTVSYQKNSAGNITNIAPSLSYDYDANGNITHIYENGVLKIRYHYDGLNRLSREDNSDIDKTVVYSYDKFGNIRSKVEYALSFGELGTAINTVPYRYQSGGGAATKYGDETINYDLDGNMQNYRGYTMTWAKGRQLSALSGNGLTMSFKYDNNSIRTKKTVNDVETEYFYVGDTLVSQKTGDEVINFAYTASGAPYGFTYNGTSYFYLTSIQGDIIGIYDSNGNVVVEYTYDSWGKLISITGSLASTIGVKNPLRYRGYYYDTETSLYYLQARYYDPDICRFISADALLVAGNDYIQGMNRYAYCYNNPIMYLDPSGMASEKDVSEWFGGLLLFAEMCYYFGLTNWIPGISDISGEIVDFEVAIYDEFVIADWLAIALTIANDVAIGYLVGSSVSKILSGSGKIVAIITKFVKKVYPTGAGIVSGIGAAGLETTLSTLFGSINIFSNVAPGRYKLMAFLFMEEGKNHEYIPHIYYVLKFLGPDIKEGEKITKDMQTDSSLELMIYQIGFN